MSTVLSLSATDWRAELTRFGAAAGEPYFLPEYHGLHEANGDGVAAAWLVREGAKQLLVAGLRVPIPQTESPGRWDLQSCNGYGGPLATEQADAGFLAAAWAAWAGFVAAEGCVAAFFRLHPLLHNERWLPAAATLREDRPTVFVPLSGGAASVFETSDDSHRRQVHKGRRNGAIIQWGGADRWAQFEQLYGEAMERLGAPATLRFSPAYFKMLQALPGAELATLEEAGSHGGAAVFFFGQRWGHYHLGARNPAAGSHVMNSLMQAGLDEAARRGLAGVHFGGGRTPAPDDSLLRFKRHLGGEMATFRVGLVVTDPQRFTALKAAWAARTGREPAWLLGYRQPAPAHPPAAPAGSASGRMNFALRPAVPDDFDVFYQIKCEPKNIEWTGHNTPPDRERLRAWFAQQLVSGSRVILVGLLDGEAVGYAYVDQVEEGIETSVAVREQYEGKGVGKAIVASVVDYCRQEHSGRPLHAWILAGNPASIRIHEHAGYRRTGRCQTRTMDSGKTAEMVLFVLESNA